ncbi:MAG TPA: c-type cytochrome [Burkholderiaceae bacterium]|nr:c-type cytochrome [Burkholderiaceae bacterium]
MKRIPFELAVLAISVGMVMAVAAPAFGQASAASTSSETNAEKLARGKYLVTVAGCNDCHTPWVMGPKGPAPDMTRMLSGHPESDKLPPPPAPHGPWIASASATKTAHSGPWGISYTANLTPDAETGLGKWTQRNFTETIRTGRHMGRGRQILPPMPIPMYRNFTDADLEAIFSYLQTIPAVKNRVPEPLPPAQPVAAK